MIETSRFQFRRPEDRTLPRLLAHHAGSRGDQRFYRFANDDAMTFAEMEGTTNALARGLEQLGVRRGDTVALVLPNCAEFVPVWFAICKLGAVEVPVNHELRGELLRRILADCGAAVVVCHSRFVEAFVEAAHGLPNIHTVIIVGREAVSIQGALASVPYSQLLASDQAPVPDPTTFVDPIAILYTSGTSGRSKGVVSSHHQYYVWAESIAANMQLSREDSYYHCLPLFYGDAQFFAVYFALVFGTCVTMHERFSASRYWSQVRDSGATATNMLGAMAHILAKQDPNTADRDNPLQVCNAIPLPAEPRKFEERFGLRLVTGYGQTETNLVCYDRPFEQRLGSCGKVGPDHEVAIVDEQDISVPSGEVGEIVVRPRTPWSIFSGYHGLPTETQRAWRNLWFHTGDAGRIDEDGWLYFVERVKDVVRRRGENISATEVELAINAHPLVLECAAIAVPADLGEDDLMVVVVRQEGAVLQPMDIARHCEARLPRFMIPRYIEMREDLLPRTPSEKVAKEELRRQGVSSSTWDREADTARR